MNPKLLPLTALPLFAFAPNAPAIYGQGLTDYEVVSRLFAAINEDRERINTFTDLMNKLSAYLNELDDTVKAEVIAYITEMYENGELADIVEGVLIQESAKLSARPKNSNLTFMRKWRRLFQMESNDAAESYNSAFNKSLYSYTQGATQFTHNGVDYVAVANQCVNFSASMHNNQAEIHIYNLETGNEVAHTDPLTLGHANGIAYLDGYLYIVNCYMYSNAEDTDNNYDVHRISLNEILQGVLLPTVATQEIHPDIEYYDGLSSISEHDGQLYINAKFATYTLDWDNGTATMIVPAQPTNTPPNIQGRFQDFDVTTDFIYYLTYRPACIVRYNRTTQMIDWVYEIDEMLNGGMYRRGEVEGLTVHDNGTAYLITAQHLQWNLANQWDMTEVFVQNLADNRYQMSNPLSAAMQGYETQRLLLYVDNTATSDLNPSQTFWGIAEALWYATNQKRYDTVVIRLRTSSRYFCYIASNKNIYLEGYTTGLQDEDPTTHPTIGGLFVDGGNVYIENVNFQETLCRNNSEHLSGVNGVQLRARNANITVTNAAFSKVSAGSNTSLTDSTAMFIRASVLKFNYGSSWEDNGGTTQSSFQTTSGNTFLNTYNSIVNGHEHIVISGSRDIMADATQIASLNSRVSALEG